MAKNPNWQEADQLAIYKRALKVEIAATKEQLQQAVRAGLESEISGFQVQRPNYSITLPLCLFSLGFLSFLFYLLGDCEIHSRVIFFYSVFFVSPSIGTFYSSGLLPVVTRRENLNQSL